MKSPVPETRHSLILRLTDRCDSEAWDQFVAIYEPLVYRLARAKGFQDADARELSQEVLIAVSRAVERWQPDAELGRFRDWLFRIARNLMINFMTRRHHQSIASGDGRIAELLNQQVDPNSADSATFDLEYRREVFRWAADRVRVSDSEVAHEFQRSVVVGQLDRTEQSPSGSRRRPIFRDLHLAATHAKCRAAGPASCSVNI